jgi:hypothetical protein
LDTDIDGHFTLPSEVAWGQAVLPAGDYAFTVTAPTIEGRIFVYAKSKSGRSAIILPNGIRDIGLGQSALFLERSREGFLVRALYLAHCNRLMSFNAPGGRRELLDNEFERITISVHNNKGD